MTTDSTQTGRCDLSPADESPRVREYFDLRDALAEAGCPICARVLRAGREALEALAGSAFQDARERKRALAFRALCNAHAWPLREMPVKPVRLAEAEERFLHGRIEALQGAIARLEDSSRRRWFRGVRGWGRRGLDASPRWHPIRRCPACRAAGAAEHRDIALLLDLITDMEFARAFEGSAGLCLPHLTLTIRLAPEHPNLARLLEAHVPKVKRLQADLQDFIRRAKAPLATLTEAEQDALWSRVLEWTTGKPGTFGPERRLAQEEEGWLVRLVRIFRPSGLKVPGPIADNGHPRPMGELERLELENATLRRRLVEVSREWAEESARRAALQFQVHKLTEDVKVLELNLAGARGESESGALQAERLHEEIRVLRDEIRRLRGQAEGASDPSGEQG